MSAWGWYLIIGIVLLLMAVSSSWVRRLPLTSAVLYLLLGAALGPVGFAVFHLDRIESTRLLERLTEISVCLSLFTAGLKLRLPLRHPRWRSCLRLAFGAMAITVALLAVTGHYLLGLPWGGAILLGAILAPTDPVLASDVQVRSAEDDDSLRFTLTGEAGLNDGTAFPFVMLGLGLLGLHDIGELGWKWLAIDLFWAIGAGLGIGALFGIMTARGIVHLRRHHREAVILDDFLALGLLALSYGTALAVHAYGFLAAFAAGLALRMTERSLTGERIPAEVKEVPHSQGHDRAVGRPQHAPAYAAQAILLFNEQIERLAEVALVVIVGGLLLRTDFDWRSILVALLLFLVIRPLSIAVGLAGVTLQRRLRWMVSWFGIRGIGSLYYLSFSLGQGVSGGVAEQLTAVVLSTVAASIVLHGVSVTPMLERAGRR